MIETIGTIITVVGEIVSGIGKAAELIRGVSGRR